MKDDQLINQLELYSNAIIGFVVLQAIAYAFYFGTNEFFNCTVKTAKFLAEGLTLLFVVVAVLASYATRTIGRLLLQLSQNNFKIVKRVYFSKGVAVALFSCLPVVVTFAYGVLDYPEKYECKRAKHVA